MPVLVGPTGVGKTAVAVALAAKLPLTVISADSRQVYRGLDIGTAKPTIDERAHAPHVGLDVVAPGERYSAGRFARDAAEWLAEVPPGRTPVVVGGTGFYIRALADGLFREPIMDSARRDRLRAWTASLHGLGRWAARLDPAFAGGGKQRAQRAVEVGLLTGHPLSWWQQHAHDHGVMRPWFVRLSAPRAVLHQRIERRTAEMLARGWIAEVRGVMAQGVPPDAPGLDGVGYKEIVQYLAGAITDRDLPAAINTATRQYAKRQETWFRHQLGAHPVLALDATDDAAILAQRIIERWEARSD
ncbi:MAG TPA: tRNA (adenosine(37)-N6)-dimethylallyltransferase MiaA [Gemmatimonadales bacterium]